VRPGQVKPNELETAILARIATEHPFVGRYIHGLHVLSREFTGVGSFTRFACEAADGGTRDEPLGLNALISMPTVPTGMGAILWCRSRQPECLEIFVYGDTLSDGVFEGFSIEPKLPSNQQQTAHSSRLTGDVSDTWSCCFCGAEVVLDGPPVALLRVVGKDASAQELRAHARCLKQRVRPGVPLLSIDELD
jgi:hypothetical protein